MEEFTSGFVDSLISVCTEIVSLSLNHISSSPCSSVAVVPAESGRQSRNWNSSFSSHSYRSSPSWNARRKFVEEKWVQNEIFQLWISLESVLNFPQKFGSDDASSSPHQSAGTVVDLPVIFRRASSQKSESLSIGNQL